MPGNSRQIRQKNRSKAIRDGVNNAGSMISNIFSRLTSKFTRRNRNHLVVPANGSPRTNRQSSSISPLELSEINTAFGLNKRKSTFRKSGAKKRRSLAQ